MMLRASDAPLCGIFERFAQLMLRGNDLRGESVDSASMKWPLRTGVVQRLVLAPAAVQVLDCE